MCCVATAVLKPTANLKTTNKEKIGIANAETDLSSIASNRRKDHSLVVVDY